MAQLVLDRRALVQRGKKLEYFTVVWNSLEGIVAILAGVLAGSISLLGFGIDSFIEVISGAALLWRIYADAQEARRERIERTALRIVGICFLALAAYVASQATSQLMQRKAPEHSLFGIVIACLSLIVMPVLSRAKRKLASQLGSVAMNADAKQTEFCVYLSLILLGGLLLNSAFGLWWADPLAGLCMILIIVKEGLQTLRGGPACC